MGPVSLWDNYRLHFRLESHLRKIIRHRKIYCKLLWYFEDDYLKIITPKKWGFTVIIQVRQQDTDAYKSEVSVSPCDNFMTLIIMKNKCHRIVTSSQLHFRNAREKRTTKCVLKVKFVNRCSQGQRSSLEKRPYHMENLGPFWSSGKSQICTIPLIKFLLLCRTRALDLHWFQIKYLESGTDSLDRPIGLKIYRIHGLIDLKSN